MQKKSVPSASGAARAAIHTGCKFALAAVAMSLSAACLAATVTFPSTGYDLASAEDWGGTLPGTADVIKFGGTTNITVTASADVEFGGLTFATESRTVTLDMRESVSGGSPRRIKMNGPAYVNEVWLAEYILRGGLWDFGDYSVAINLAYKNQQGASARIDGGAVVLCGSLFGQWVGKDDPLYVVGEGTIVTTKVVQVAQFNGRNNRFEFTDGAKVVITGTSDGALSVGGNADNSNSSGNTLRVGGGATLEKIGSGASWVGRAGNDNKLLIEDGGTARLPGIMYFGSRGGSQGTQRAGNRIEVTGADSRLECGAVYCGNAAESGNSNNVAIVSDGGTLSSDRWYLDGQENGIVVSNGTVTVGEGGILCQATSTNCYLRLQGTHPSFVSRTASGTQSIFKNGFTLRFELPEEGYDGTVAWPFLNQNYAYADSSFRVEVTGIEKMAKRMKAQGIERRTVNLANFSNGINGVTDAMVAGWNAALPEGAKLAFANNKITLDVRANAPTVVSLR